MPTNPDRHQQAVRAMAKWLYEWNYIGLSWDDEHDQAVINDTIQEAEELLALRDPSGQPWVVILDSDQNMMVKTVDNLTRPDEVQDIMLQIRQQGFRKVYLPAARPGER